MLTRLRHILEMIRFSHTLFALPFALLAMLMAFKLTDLDRQQASIRLQSELTAEMGSVPPSTASVENGNESAMEGGEIAEEGDSSPRLKQSYVVLCYFGPSKTRIAIGVILCMVFARSAAMAFNRVIDSKFDAENPRTKMRHIPRGDLSSSSVSNICFGNSLAFIAATFISLPNPLPLLLSIPVLLILLGYSYAKRFTSLAHFWLGAALMLAPVCAWIAVRGGFVMKNPADLLPALVLGTAVLLWVAGFDVIYACQDEAFDRQAGLHSVPVRLGVKNALRLAALCHAGMIALLAALPWFFPLFGWVYWTGIAAVAVLLVYEHSLVREDDLTRVNVAFFNVNAIVSIGLLLIGALDLMM